jgi:KDEL-tailed cysteine endopeptidase
MLSLLLFLCSFVAVVSKDHIGHDEYTMDKVYNFRHWKKYHGKVYGSYEEEMERFMIYRKNVMEISRRNSLNRTVHLEPNKFADLSAEEFQGRYVGYNYRNVVHEKDINVPYLRGNVEEVHDIPSSIDWVSAGAVTPVKNQGQCGSCWSFSTTGAVEGAWYIAKGELVSLSEQQLVDCSSAQGNNGCNGGMMDFAFTYIIQNGGICSEDSYPYLAENGTCRTCTPVAKLHSYVDVTPNNETALMIAVAKQPVSVAVEADGFDWQFYSGGVITDSCGTNLDHGVLVVGYGMDTTSGGYWKVKNSWGPDWGESGYIRIGRGGNYGINGECGILMDPSYPVV